MSGIAVDRAGDLARGDHACLVAESERERWAVLSQFVRGGLARGERTLFVAATGREDEVHARLEVDGVGGGELVVAPAAVVMGYEGGAAFDPVEREEIWRGQVQAALADGFSGLCVAADMDWMTEIGLAIDEMLDYEHRCTAVTSELPATALCAYDRHSFSDGTLARVGHAHPICRGSTVGPAGVFVSRTMEIAVAGPGVLKLSGEIDVSNVPSLSSALRTTARDRTAVLLDLGALEFIDVAGMRTIHDTARRLAASGGELVLLSPRPLIARMIEMLGMGATVTLERTGS